MKNKAKVAVSKRFGKQAADSNKIKKLKRRIKGGAAAGVVSAGVFLAALFGNPTELTENNTNIHEKPAVVQMVDMETEEDEGYYNELFVKKKGKKRFSERIKQFILKMPVVVRAIVGVPLWAAGWLVIFIISLLWKSTGVVILPFIIKFLLFLLVIFIVVFLVIKSVHPDIPVKQILKKIFKKNNWIMTAVSAIILSTADTILVSVWKDYGWIRWIIIFILGLILILLVFRFFKRRRLSHCS